MLMISFSCRTLSTKILSWGSIWREKKSERYKITHSTNRFEIETMRVPRSALCFLLPFYYLPFLLASLSLFSSLSLTRFICYSHASSQCCSMLLVDSNLDFKCAHNIGPRTNRDNRHTQKFLWILKCHKIVGALLLSGKNVVDWGDGTEIIKTK